MRSLDQQAIMYGQVAYNQPLDMPEGQPGEEVATDENAPVLMPLWTPEPTAPADPAAAAEFEGVDAVL